MSIKRKLILTHLVIAVVPMIFVGTLGYYSAKQTIESARISALTGICDRKVKIIEDFFSERKKEISMLRTDPSINGVVDLLTQRPEGFGPADQARLHALDGLMNTLKTATHFTNAVIATRDGQIVYALTGRESSEYLNKPLFDLAIEPAKRATDGIRISNVFLTGRTSSPMAVLVTSPIYGPQNTPRGLLSFEYDFTPLFRSIQDSTSLGTTGETLIAMKAGNAALSLSPLGPDPNAARLHHIPTGDNPHDAIQQALSGSNGQGPAVDDNGKSVIAAWRHIAFLDWGLVAQIDAAEVFRPMGRLRNFSLFLGLMVILLCICVSAIAGKSFSDPINVLKSRVELIGKGRLDQKVGISTKDEIGQLARTFDRMTDRLKVITASRKQLNREISERRRAEKDLRRSIDELDDRVKELNCLFEISRLVERHSQSFDQTLQGIVELIPSALKFPHIAYTKIILEEQAFQTANFKETPWQLTHTISVNGSAAGKLIVGYLKEMPPRSQSPFVMEERALLTAVSERVGKIMERRISQEALEESEKRFRALVENSQTGISIVQDNLVIYQNKEQERILGPIPRPPLLADLGNIHPNDADKVKQLIARLEKNATQSLESDFRIYTHRGPSYSREMKWINFKGLPIDYKGRQALLVNLVDMTQAKQMEQLLTIQDKMASLGRVAAGIAHEIRNPLSGINIYLDTLKKLHHKPGSAEKVENIIRQTNLASQKIESVIRRVMDFAKPSEPKLTLIDINVPIGEAIKLTAVTLRKSGIRFIKSLAEKLPAVNADRHLIEEMVLNLINNATEAMRGHAAGKTIKVSSAVQGKRIIVSVSDSGPGIPLRIRDRVFEPYFTTKSEGTGIGLSLCHRIIMDHGGSLIIRDSTLGGAEFRAEFPIQQS